MSLSYGNSNIRADCAELGSESECTLSLTVIVFSPPPHTYSQVTPGSGMIFVLQNSFHVQGGARDQVRASEEDNDSIICVLLQGRCMGLVGNAA